MEKDKAFVESSMYFLKDAGLYTNVKPYTLTFTPEDGTPRSNIEHESRAVKISDIRYSSEQFSMERNAFTVLNFPKLPPMIWEDKATVVKEYYPVVETEVMRAFGNVRCIVFKHELRKRELSFPISTGLDYTFGQPLIGVHVDFVSSSAEYLIRRHVPELASNILNGRFVVATLWRPIVGPNDDWPLALCDFTTVDQHQDLEVSDYVTEDNCSEHGLLYYRESHKWWYMSRQTPEDAFLIRHFDSDKGMHSGIPHAAFNNPNSKGSKPRQSVEVIMVIYWPQSEEQVHE